MRSSKVALACIVAIAALGVSAPAAHADGDRLEAARYFDQLGVKAYADGRYADAIVYFREAYDNGGPPSELWNIAKCTLQTGDAKSAVGLLDSYLDRDDVAPDDRHEAEKLLAEIKRRPSQVSIASAPTGATVKIDDRLIGSTPTTTTVAPGEHTLHLEHRGGESYDRTFVAQYGLTIAIGTDLGAAEATNPPPPPARPIKRIGIEVLPFGLSIAIRGDAPASAFLSPVVGLTYTFVAGRRALFGVGVRLAAAFERWTTSAGTPNTAVGCNLPNDYAALELLLHPFLFGAVRVTRAVDLGARAGLGLAGLASPAALGGDYFEPGCTTTTGLRGDFFAALDLSIALGRIRILIEPVTLNVHSGYGGARTTPHDTTGLWTRVGASLGLALDF